MIRRLNDTGAIPAKISRELDRNHPRWVERVLLLIGFYTPERPAIRRTRATALRRNEVTGEYYFALPEKARQTVH